MIEMFRPEHFFSKQNILKLDLHRGYEPLLSSGIQVSDEYLTMLTTGKAYKPDFNIHFPAKRLTTKLDWKDLVLDPNVLEEINEISAWIKHQEVIMEEWGLKKMLKRGFRSLFYGPPGTGKTLTACLLGKSLELDVYRVDLSQVVSKYIGETEKNMAQIFDQAENKNWILFFDEADALFGKRTSTSDSKDRHANQEVAYLLQRVEDYAGVVILATNLKANMDTAFTRRFQSIVYFPAPTYEQRLRLWRNSFEGHLDIDADVDFKSLASDYKITGGSIINVLRYCTLSALERGSRTINMSDIREAVKKELKKEGKTLD
jgi:SpoVK/Ycf46/Vps4 family AAA+-type ATPase